MKKAQIIILVISLLVIDQVSKVLVMQNMDLYQQIPIIDNFFKLFYIRNDGAAFSILSGQTWLFYLIYIPAFYVIYYFFKEAKTKLGVIATAILLAGTIGNLIDRILYKEVIDFLSFSFGSYNFAIFNIADVCVCVGVALLLIDSLRKKEKNG